MTTTTQIDALASQLDRLCPSQVDSTLAPNGQREAGHKGYDGDGDTWPSVGGCCAGGKSGESVFAIHLDDVAAAVDRLAALEAGALDRGDLKAELSGLRIEWHI